MCLPSRAAVGYLYSRNQPLMAALSTSVLYGWFLARVSGVDVPGVVTASWRLQSHSGGHHDRIPTRSN